MSAITRMLVPTDFGATSDLAVRYATELARKVGASIHLLHVIEEPAYSAAYSDGYFVNAAELRQPLIDQAQRRLAAAVKRCAPVPTTTDIQFGRPAQAIGEQALTRGTDLIIMGTHGRGVVAHLFVGSVAERVVRTAPCPVLTVRDTNRTADARRAEARAEDAHATDPMCLVTK